MAASRTDAKEFSMDEGCVFVSNSKSFYQVIGKTKSGNAKVVRLKTRVLGVTNRTHTTSDTLVAPSSERTTFDSYVKQVKDGLKIIGADEYVDEIYDPSKTYTVEWYG